MLDGEGHAIARSAVDRKHLSADSGEPQRLMQRQGMTDSGAFTVRSHDPDIAEPPHGGGQRMQTRRGNAIVVGDQNFHVKRPVRKTKKAARGSFQGLSVITRILSLRAQSQSMSSRVVGTVGFEPTTSRTPSECATRLRYAPTLFDELSRSHRFGRGQRS